MYDYFHRISEEKQRHIIDSAMQVFARHGYHKASTNEIVKLAGISKGLLFHYFGSKPGLFCYLYRYSLDYTMTNAPGYDYSNKDLFDTIDRINNAKLDMMIDYPAMAQFMVKAYFETHSDVADFIQKANQSYSSTNLTVIKDGINTDRLKEGLDIDAVWNALMWISDGFMKMQVERGITDAKQLFEEFEIYKSILKYGIYKEE